MPQKKQYGLDYLPEDWTYYRQDIQKMRDVCNGLRNCDKSQYLIQKTAEQNDHYRNRLRLAVFENRVQSAISEFAGVLSMNYHFSPDTPSEIVNQQYNVDGADSNFSVWLNTMLQKLLRDGCIGWFVGWNEELEEWKFVYVDPLSLRAPIVLTQDGTDRLFGFTVESTEKIVNGYSTEKESVYYRHELAAVSEDSNEVYYQYTKFVRGKRPDGQVDFIPVGDPVIPTGANGEPLTEIPFIWLSLGSDKTPLAFDYSFFSTLADLNILQYNKVSELNTAESNCNMLTIIRKHPGEVPDYSQDIYTGTNAVIEVGNAQFGGGIEYLEPTGRAIEITHQRNNDRDAKMDAIAKQFITGDTVERTKYQVQVEITSVQARLLTLVSNIQDAMQRSFSYAMNYAAPYPIENAGGITINSEAIRPPVQVDELRLWQELTDLGYLDKDSFLQLLQVSGAFPSGFVWDNLSPDDQDTQDSTDNQNDTEDDTEDDTDDETDNAVT